MNKYQLNEYRAELDTLRALANEFNLSLTEAAQLQTIHKLTNIENLVSILLDDEYEPAAAPVLERDHLKD